MGEVTRLPEPLSTIFDRGVPLTPSEVADRVRAGLAGHEGRRTFGNADRSDVKIVVHPMTFEDCAVVADSHHAFYWSWSADGRPGVLGCMGFEMVDDHAVKPDEVRLRREVVLR